MAYTRIYYPYLCSESDTALINSCDILHLQR